MTDAANLMPKSKEAQEILKARALELAKLKLTTEESQEGDLYVRFTLGKNEFYGVAYSYVKEVLRNVKPAFLPCTPAYITGVINWRGNLIPIIDIKQFFHSESIKYDGNAYAIVVKANDVTMGILVDAIVGSETYQPSNLKEPLSSADAVNPAYVRGIHKGITAIINIEAVITALSIELEKQPTIPL